MEDIGVLALTAMVVVAIIFFADSVRQAYARHVQEIERERYLYRQLLEGQIESWRSWAQLYESDHLAAASARLNADFIEDVLRDMNP